MKGPKINTLTTTKTALMALGRFVQQFLFVLLINFALGGISFFLLTLARWFPPVESDTDNAYVFVLLTNALESLVGVLVLQVFLRYFQKKIRTRLGQYLALLGGVYGIEIVFWALLEGRGSPVNILLDLFNFHPFNLIFRSHLLIGVALLYHWRTREQIQMRKITEQEYQLLLLKELKTKAELEALQAKINPHFLYNALNSIASLVHEDPDKAEKMVLLLARFFRYSTQRSPHYYHSLQAELEMVETYLEVEKVRYGPRLQYEIILADASLGACAVPSFLLQPLVENALKHGIAPRAEMGKVILRIEAQQDRLCICLHDNGSPFPESLLPGYGLQSTMDKLRLLGGKTAKIEFQNTPQKQVVLWLETKTFLKPKQEEPLSASS